LAQENDNVSSFAKKEDIFSPFDLPEQVHSVIEQQRETIAPLNGEVASLREKLQINQNTSEVAREATECIQAMPEHI